MDFARPALTRLFVFRSVSRARFGQALQTTPNRKISQKDAKLPHVEKTANSYSRLFYFRPPSDWSTLTPGLLTVYKQFDTGGSLFCTMSTATLNLPHAETRKSRWIISPVNDLTWFIFSALGGYLTILLFKSGTPLLPVFLVFTLLVDGPHVWSTMTRTYFDKSERKKRKLQLFA